MGEIKEAESVLDQWLKKTRLSCVLSLGLSRGYDNTKLCQDIGVTELRRRRNMENLSKPCITDSQPQSCSLSFRERCCHKTQSENVLFSNQSAGSAESLVDALGFSVTLFLLSHEATAHYCT